MKYQNPIIPGFYPDPSICKEGNNYYLVTSSFEYFPGVPIFRSTDLINWEQIGHCLTRKSQLNLDESECSGGIFAPTIRYHQGKFYMITTTYVKNNIEAFYVSTDNPEAEWSEPVYIDIIGIDPSLYFENGKTFVQYSDYSEGISVIKQVEIELSSGKLLCEPKIISYGCGGRDVEAPHLFKRNSWYYLMLAEGGTREGHMATLSRGKSIWGPFEPCPYNPILSNRDKAIEKIQSIGHADLIEDDYGEVWMVALGTRPFKHRSNLGRETMLTPAFWTDDGWLKSKDGYMPFEVEINRDIIQKRKSEYFLDFAKKKLPTELVLLRADITRNISFNNDTLEVIGNTYTLNDLGSPIFLAFRQTSYTFETTTSIEFEPERETQEAGLAILMDNEHHMELVITLRNDKKVLLLRKKVADIIEEKIYELYDQHKNIALKISGSNEKYYFSFSDRNNNWIQLDWTFTKHLSSESTFSIFTGVVVGLYVTGENTAYVSKLNYNIN